MKKIIFLFLLSFIFLISCSNSSDLDIEEQPDNQKEEQDASETPDNEQSDENLQEEQDEPEVVDEEITPDNEPEQPEEEQNTPQSDPIGNFNLNFSGQIVMQFELKNIGGQGTTNFMYNGMPYNFKEIKVLYDLFPLAMSNSGNIIVLWIDGLTMADIQGTNEKQVFGIALPQSAGVGSGNMKDISSYAFFGDITVTAMSGQFDIKCVRAVSDSGQYDITSNDGANITFTANGDLFDPALAGSMIPYPACE